MFKSRKSKKSVSNKKSKNKGLDKILALLFFDRKRSYVLLIFNTKNQLNKSPHKFRNFFYNYCHNMHTPLKIFQQQSQPIPTQTTRMPIKNNQPVKGSNMTSKMPRPKPIRHTAKVFLKSLSILIYLLSLYYYIKDYIKL